MSQFISNVTSTSSASKFFDTYLINATSGDIVFTLVDVSSSTNGVHINLIRTDSSTNTVTIQGKSGVQTINGSSSVLLLTRSALFLSAFGGVWYSPVIISSLYSPSLIQLVTFNSNGNLTSGNFLTYFGQSIELQAQILITRNIVVKNMYVSLTSAPGVGFSRTFTLRKNAVSSSLIVTISGNTTTGNNTNTDVSFVQGDLLSLLNVRSGGGSRIRLGW